MIWAPKVSVAAVIEKDGRFLLVEEETNSGIRINQPAGHLDEGESLLEAVIRETREETAYLFAPESLVGVYRWQVPDNGPTYLRFCFCGSCSGPDPSLKLDQGILRTLWMSRSDLAAHSAELRSPLVLAGVDDYLRGRRYAIDLLRDLT